MLFFSFISGSGGKERLADRGVYVWLTCYGWCCVGLILTPTQAPLCFLLQAVPWTRTGKMLFLCFPFSVSFFNLCIFSFLHASIFLKQDFCLCGTDVRSQLTLIARLTGSCFIFRVVAKWQRVWSQFPLGAMISGAAGCARGFWYLCVLCIINGVHSLKSYLLRSISAPITVVKITTLSISSLCPWGILKKNNQFLIC